jgi:hypothetical protein
MSSTSYRPRPTDLAAWRLGLLLVPWFVVFLLLTRLLHVAGHLVGASFAGAKPIGLYAPLLGFDLPLANYPDPGWSAHTSAAPFFAGGMVAALLLALLAGFLWPASPGLGSRLLPLQLAAVLLLHGVVEPLLDFSARGELLLTAELAKLSPALLLGGALLLAALGLAWATVRFLRLSSVVTGNIGPGGRLLLALGFFALPEGAFQLLSWFFARSGFVELAIGGLFLLLPVAVALLLPPRHFYEKVEAEGSGRLLASGLLLSAMLLGGWWFLFVDFSPPHARGLVWTEPGVFNNVRHETPVRRLRDLGDRTAGWAPPVEGITVAKPKGKGEPKPKR